MAKQTIEEIRAELDLLNEKMAKKQNTSDTQIIAANLRQTEAYRESLSKALTGRIRTEEEIEKWRKNYDGSGENNSMYGRNHTEESKKQISINRKGKVGRTGPQTEETKEKMRKPRSEEGKANMRKPRAKKTCPHCKFEGAGGIMLRWHFDNCKQNEKNN